MIVWGVLMSIGGVCVAAVGMLWWQLTVGRWVVSNRAEDYWRADLGMRIFLLGIGFTLVGTVAILIGKVTA